MESKSLFFPLLSTSTGLSHISEVGHLPRPAWLVTGIWEVKQVFFAPCSLPVRHCLSVRRKEGGGSVGLETAMMQINY